MIRTAIQKLDSTVQISAREVHELGYVAESSVAESSVGESTVAE